MVTLNSEVRIQDRAGNTISTVPLDGPGGFWDSLDSPNAFDPKVLYDPFANRWMFTAVADARTVSSSVLMGVSQTSDPTGMWNLYRIDAAIGNTTWADYPSMGFNKDWIVVQVNMFSVNGAFSRADIYVFNKGDLYAGGAGLFALLHDTSGATQVPALTYDNSLATLYLVGARTSTQLRVSQITGPVASETLTLGVAFPTSPDAWRFRLPENSAPQLGSATGITTNDDRIQNVIYRNDALWAVHTIFLPSTSPTRSAVQWWQFSPTGKVLQRGRIDDVNGNIFYAFPSIAVNKFDDVLIGYSSFGANQFASANYSFREAGDPLSTLQSDALLKAGEDTYVKDFGTGVVRWGDYSNTVVDPVNDINLWTIQEYAAAEVGPTPDDDRWGTWWGRIQAPTVRADLELTVAGSPDPVTIGTNLTYTITVTNAGPDTATDVVVTDALTAGVTFVSAASSQGSCSGTSNISCNLGSLANAETATVTLVVKPWAVETLNNTATATTATSDPNSSNNTDSVTTTLTDPPPRLRWSWLFHRHVFGL
jgi:uncharacterized repeat protein (TIGR01451 family)